MLGARVVEAAHRYPEALLTGRAAASAGRVGTHAGPIAAAPQVHGYDFPLVTALPFVLLLLAIAVLPLALPRWWHRDRNRALVAALAAAPVAVLLLFVLPGALAHTLRDYVSFVVLLGAFYTISGGIVLEGDLEATPRVNAAFLACGAVIASVVGTTGASMLLLRPLLRTNSERRRTAHIPFFFILIVSNAGGMLTPLGDPPLFLGYLRGVPFFWTLRLFPIWALSIGWLLGVFLIVDRISYRRETPQRSVPTARASVLCGSKASATSRRSRSLQRARSSPAPIARSSWWPWPGCPSLRRRPATTSATS